MKGNCILFLSLVGWLFSGLVSCGQQPQSVQEEQTIVHLMPIQFHAAIQGENVVLIDLRTPGEIEEGIVEGAKHLDYFGDDFEESLKDLNLKEKIYLYCQSGGRSGDAAEKLESLGAVKVYNLDGGIEAWLGEKLSLIKP
jgi:rhodanese-related sulfurtransferase